MRIENFIAKAFIFKNNKNNEIKSSSLIVLTAISVAIIFFIAAVSIMNGYTEGILKLFIEVRSGHLEYYYSSSRTTTESVVGEYNEMDETKFVSMYREVYGLFTANSRSSVLTHFRSINNNIFSEDEAFNECIKIVDGSNSLGFRDVLISNITADKLKLKVGDTVFFSTILKDDDYNVKVTRLTVKGIFTTGLNEFDEQLAYVNEETGDIILDEALRYYIFIKLNDIADTEDFSKKLRKRGYYGVRTWKERNYNEYTAMKFQKNVISFIVILVVFVAILNILTTVYLIVLKKQPEIGVLKSIGMSPVKIIMIFMLNGIFLSAIGILIGISLGLFIKIWLNEIITGAGFIINSFIAFVDIFLGFFIEIEKSEAIEFFSKEFYLDKIYTIISFNEILFIAFLGFIFAIISSIFPAFKAGFIKPKEVLRND